MPYPPLVTRKERFEYFYNFKLIERELYSERNFPLQELPERGSLVYSVVTTDGAHNSEVARAISRAQGSTLPATIDEALPHDPVDVKRYLRAQSLRPATLDEMLPWILQTIEACQALPCDIFKDGLVLGILGSSFRGRDREFPTLTLSDGHEHLHLSEAYWPECHTFLAVRDPM